MGVRPLLGQSPSLAFPTGSPAFTAGEVLPGLNWLYGWDVTDFISIGGSTQVNRAVEESESGRADSYTELAQSLTIGYGLTDSLGAYTEWFAFFPHGAEQVEVEHYADGGLTYLLTDDLQWDSGPDGA